MAVIFSDKLLRGYVINFLPDKYKSYLEFNKYDKKIMTSLERKSLIGHGIEIFIHILG